LSLGKKVGSLEALVKWCNRSFIQAQPLDLERDLHAHRMRNPQQHPPIRPGEGGAGRLRAVYAPLRAPDNGDEDDDAADDGEEMVPGSGGGSSELLVIEAEYVSSVTSLTRAGQVAGGGGGSSSSSNTATTSSSSGSTASKSGRVLSVRVRTENLGLAASVVSDLCSWLEVSELTATAHFPLAMHSLKCTLDQVAEYNRLRLRLAAEGAEGSQRVKSLVVKAEDARLMGDMPLIAKHTNGLFAANSEMTIEYLKRSNNHEALLTCLRQVNVAIDLCSKLRVGAARSQLIADARAAVKASNAAGLVHVLSQGRTSKR